MLHLHGSVIRVSLSRIARLEVVWVATSVVILVMILVMVTCVAVITVIVVIIHHSVALSLDFYAYLTINELQKTMFIKLVVKIVADVCVFLEPWLRHLKLRLEIVLRMKRMRRLRCRAYRLLMWKYLGCKVSSERILTEKHL